jgi:hypothetical protein
MSMPWAAANKGWFEMTQTNDMRHDAASVRTIRNGTVLVQTARADAGP